jgi:hypothetical protein
MQKRSSIHKRRIDPSITDVVESSFPSPEKNAAAVALGRLGGLKGGRARAEKLSPKKRTQIAKKAALARWAKKSNL